MTMKACIEERKTTLTDVVAGALGRVVTGDGAEVGWGIALELVQVAQVFIVDEALRLKLEAEPRNEVAARAARSDIQMREQVSLAKVSSERRLAAAELERERVILDVYPTDCPFGCRMFRRHRGRCLLRPPADDALGGRCRLRGPRLRPS